MKAKIEAASSFDLPPRRGPSTCTAGAGASAAAAAVTAAATEATAARIRRELSSKRVRLLVVRSKTQQHYFKTKLGKGVGAIVEACKAELALLSRHEEDSELCLYFQVCVWLFVMGFWYWFSGYSVALVTRSPDVCKLFGSFGDPSV